MEFNIIGKSQWGLASNKLEVTNNHTYRGLEVSKEGIGEEKRKINEGKAWRIAGMIMNEGSSK